jgi:hypothetical protein
MEFKNCKNFVYIALANKCNFSVADVEKKTGTENAVFQVTEEIGSFQPHSHCTTWWLIGGMSRCKRVFASGLKT